MKKILLTIIILTTVISTVKAQKDYCKDIKKYGAMSITPLPNFKGQDPLIQLSFSKSGNIITLGFFANLPGSGGSTSDFSVQFEDGSAIERVNLEVHPAPPGYGTNSIALLVSNSDMDKFRTAKIKSFTMLGQTTAPFTDDYKTRIMAYANCSLFASDPANPTVSTSTGAVSNLPEKKSIDGFWGITFGASPADVKVAIAGKGGKFVADASTPDKLSFSDVIFTQRKVDLLSTKFVNSKFYEAALVFPELSDTQLIPVFNTIVSELVNVYGPAKITKSFEKPYEEGDGYEVTAIKSGKASYNAFWKTNNGNTITMQINKSGSISLFYTDSNLEKAKEAVKSNDY